MIEDLVVSGYRDFWHAVPAMADSLRRSTEVKLVRFTGSATIGSHDATFFSLLKEPGRRRHIRALLLSPGAIGAMARRGRTSRHSVSQYVERILGTLDTLNTLRIVDALQIEVRLYDRDPQWYFWIFEDSVFVDSRTMGTGRRSPRFQISDLGGREPQELFTELFENAWNDPGSREVNFESFGDEIAQLRCEAREALDAAESPAETSHEKEPDALPSIWNVTCDTFRHSTDVLPEQRREMETSSQLCHFGSTGESRFGAMTADMVRALTENVPETPKCLFSFISPDSTSALEEKTRQSFSGRSLEKTRAAISNTVALLHRLKRDFAVNLEVHLRKELGTARIYLFDESVFVSSFHRCGKYPSPIVCFRERHQDCILTFFKRHFFESWHRETKPQSAQDPASAHLVPRSSSAGRVNHPVLVFDAQKLVLHIDGDPQPLSGGVLHLLWRIASERGAFVAMEEKIDGRTAKKRRAELGTSLGADLAREVIQTTQGFGYRFQPWVRVTGLGEAGLQFRGDMDRFPGTEGQG